MLIQSQNEYYELIATNSFDIPPEFNNGVGLEIAYEIIRTEKPAPVGKLFANRNWKKFKSAVRINARVPERLSEYIAIYKFISFEQAHKKLLRKIQHQFIELGIDESVIGSTFVRLSSFVSQIKNNTGWVDDKFNRSKELVNELADLIGRIEFNNDIKGYIEKGHFIYSNLLYQYDLNQETNELLSYSKFVSEFINDNKLIGAFLLAIEKKDPTQYEQLFGEMKMLLDKRQISETRKTTLERISMIAPEWASAIQKRIGIHGESSLPERIQDAWKWFQLNNQVRRLSSVDANKIQDSINEAYTQILRNSQELALEKAWSSKISKITAEQTAAITGWKDTIRQIGKGTGKRVARLRASAKEKMAHCQTAIPVWIMPLHQVANNFNPKDNKFDVVIIDEASQADMLALPALFLGKKVIVVGDDQQVSPDAVGQSIDNVDALIQQYLFDFPNNDLFNEKQSIYDIAGRANFAQVVLREHFRCLPEIIQFSNRLSYNGNIKPLRDASSVTVTPALVECRVDGGQREDGKKNPAEAEKILALIKAMIEHKDYTGQTIGVISMLGEEQAKLVDTLLQNNISADEYEKRRILCGTSAQFQGDERDIILLSLVNSPNVNGGPLRIVDPEAQFGMQRKRYNVAASRAKNQLWVVHSLNPDIDLKTNDLRYTLLSHVRNYKASDIQLDRAESPFEKEIMAALIERGYKVIPQLQVGAYRIDMVVESGKNKIAIECDGERYHTPDNLNEDMNRQAILERVGWRFIRIRGSKYYSNKSKTISELFEDLEKNEIYPSLNEPASITTLTNTADVIKSMAKNIENGLPISLPYAEIESTPIFEPQFPGADEPSKETDTNIGDGESEIKLKNNEVEKGNNNIDILDEPLPGPKSEDPPSKDPYSQPNKDTSPKRPLFDFRNLNN
jgi:very-short-patch-repair endonuclease